MKRLIKKASKLRTRNIILIIVGIFIAAFVIYTVIFYSIKGWQWDNIFPYLLGTGGIIEAFTGLLTLVDATLDYLESYKYGGDLVRKLAIMK